MAAGASRTNTFLAERYRRLVKHRGKGRAIVAVGNSVLTIVWHLLAKPEAHDRDLGPDFYESRINQQRSERNLIHQLESLTGQKSFCNPALSKPQPEASDRPNETDTPLHESGSASLRRTLPPAYSMIDFRVRTCGVDPSGHLW